MSKSDEAGHFFQTSEALATEERKAAKAKNKHGDPIKLPSKILAAHVDPSSNDAVYVAEAAGDIKRVVLETGEIRRVFSQGTAPLTCLAVHAKAGMVFAGSWDKLIYSIKLSNRQPGLRFTGHSDFVKCLLATSLNGKPILISGGSDAAIIVWDIDSGKQLHKLKGHTKALQDLAIDPLSLPEAASEPSDSFVLFSASSDREIRRWRISSDTAFEMSESIENPILAHDTSVYKLCFDSEGDLWTASADKTAKHLVRSGDWEADMIFQHPDFVRDVVVAEDLGLVVTACRDEDVRVWDSAYGDLICMYSGHYEEVTALVLADKKVVSVSIDGTLRKWGLAKQEMIDFEERLKEEDSGEKSDAGAGAGNMLTAEEEAELAELMDDDD